MNPKKPLFPIFIRCLNIVRHLCSGHIRPVGIGLLAVALGASPSSYAKIYKTIDANGNVSYTDVAPTKREQDAEIQVEELNTFTSPTPAPTPLPTVVLNNPDNDDEAADEVPERYESVSLVSPGEDQAIRSNAGNLTLVAGTSPELYQTHQLRFYIDGSPVGTISGTSFSLANVDRGTHTAKVAVVDDAGAVLSESTSVTFHLLRVFRPPQPRN